MLCSFTLFPSDDPAQWLRTKGQHVFHDSFDREEYEFAARVPANASKSPVKLNELKADTGYLGQNWNAAKGGYQTVPTAPIADFAGDKSTASWLLNAAYAANWQTFQLAK